MCADFANRPTSGRAPPRADQRGMSMVEMMVGMVVALLVGLAAAGSAQMFNASQRQAMSTGTASLNTTSTLSGIKNDVSAAGLGFFGSSKYLCDKLNLSMNNTMLKNGTAFSPITLTRGVRFDTIEIIYAQDVAGGANVMLKAPSNGTSVMVRSLLPVDLSGGKTPAVVLAPSTAGDPCTVRSVTGNSPAQPDTGVPQVLTFDPAGLHNKMAFATTPSYIEKDFIAVLGSLNWNRYRVDADGQLIIDRVLAGDSAVLVSNVVTFRAEFGIANDLANPRLDSWVNPNVVGALSSANMKSVRAIRLGVMTRTRQPEKPDPNTGLCAATLEMPRLFPEDAAAVAPDLPNGQWQCYRYRTVTAVVPLRNVVW